MADNFDEVESELNATINWNHGDYEALISRIEKEIKRNERRVTKVTNLTGIVRPTREYDHLLGQGSAYNDVLADLRAVLADFGRSNV